MFRSSYPVHSSAYTKLPCSHLQIMNFAYPSLNVADMTIPLLGSSCHGSSQAFTPMLGIGR
eukprot:c20196_g1_i1 orf=516-698(+)